MTGYYIACAVLVLIIAGFFPAMIASCREHHFGKWYLYSVLLFPAALIHSVILKKPVHCAGIYIHDKNDPSKRRKKVYKIVPVEKRRRLVAPTYICAVFFSKLIFGAFTAIVFFALFRTFVRDTSLLRVTCLNFAIILSLFLSIVEICGFSVFPMVSDEITKRALIFTAYSAVCSLPLYVLKTFVFDKMLPEYTKFFAFAGAVTAFALFVILILRKQRMYYSFFGKFFGYCGISMMAYAVYAAITLIMLSLSGTREFAIAIALPMRVLSLQPVINEIYSYNLTGIYSSALMHFFIQLIILFSGLSCKAYKYRELEARIEYRSKAFRMSRKRILRRHIPKIDSAKIKPLYHT